MNAPTVLRLGIGETIAWRGFWITHWYKRVGGSSAAKLLAELASLAARSVIATPVEAVYPLEKIADALAHAQRPQRAGKILLRCSDQ